MNSELKLHKKTFGELTLDELYELLRVRSEVLEKEADFQKSASKILYLFIVYADIVFFYQIYEIFHFFYLGIFI